MMLERSESFMPQAAAAAGSSGMRSMAEVAV